MARPRSPFYDKLRSRRVAFRHDQLVEDFAEVDQGRVATLASALASYIYKYLPIAIHRRKHLGDYRATPYVLMTSASIMGLSDLDRFAKFLVDNKLYMGLETFFGKSIESRVVGLYPAGDEVEQRWADPPEKVAESRGLVGLSNEEKARVRNNSVWREIDKACVIGTHRFMTSIKSGPSCINDTQVGGMTSAIAAQYRAWLSTTKAAYPHVTGVDLIIGLTYGTDSTTNNKENAILAKLMEHGFVEEDQENAPGVLIDSETRSFRVYRRVGRDFWSMIGRPDRPETARSTYLEVLLGLAKALSKAAERQEVEQGLKDKIVQLGEAISKTAFSREALPEWVRDDFTDSELVWLASALTAFYDEGI